MPLSDREITVILISQAITLYSSRLQEGKIPEHQSVIDFISKSIPQNYRSSLSIELIDEVFAFMSNQNMELS